MNGMLLHWPGGGQERNDKEQAEETSRPIRLDLGFSKLLVTTTLQSAASAIAISVPGQGSWLDDSFAGDANMPGAHCEGMM